MNLLRRSLAFRIVMMFAVAAVTGTPTVPAIARGSGDLGSALAGTYDGGQTEIAAGLELRADGRFHYALSYGALDEEAGGRWEATDDAVLLTSDPVIPPRFILVADRRAPDDRLRIKLDLPKGMSGQYFRAEIKFADGRIADPQLTEEGELPAMEPGATPTSVTLRLPIADLSSDAFRLLATGGHQLRFRFEPHDLGKVAFARTALQIDGDVLILSRHDRTIRFHRLSTAKPAG